MGYPQKLLATGESVQFELRPHWRSMVVPSIVLLGTVALTSYVLALTPDDGFLGSAGWVVLAVAVLVIGVWFVRPLLAWLTTQYVFTDRRIITRTGILSRRGMDMPLSKVNDVQFSYSVVERILRCGTLTVSSASEDGNLVIADVPGVEGVQRDIYQLVEADQVRRKKLADSE
ncbi:MAG: PH domain-containing protein [Actinomycetia bacterium]|jgi:uncharacterized membrane protein YdbT with pleckstrin-like domain|nr:PH domain-containing protein [Actinomycetes bacterium]